MNPYKSIQPASLSSTEPASLDDVKYTLFCKSLSRKIDFAFYSDSLYSSWYFISIKRHVPMPCRAGMYSHHISQVSSSKRQTTLINVLGIHWRCRWCSQIPVLSTRDCSFGDWRFDVDHLQNFAHDIPECIYFPIIRVLWSSLSSREAGTTTLG